MTTAFIYLAAVAPPGPGVFTRLGESLQAFAAPLLVVAFIVVAFVLMLRQLPGVVLVLLGFVVVASMLLAPGAWFDWIVYVSTGAGEATTTTTTVGEGGGG
ncbi:MAG: hypothetical protein AAF962_03130 [Actinomycetota bacterium]